MAITADGVVDDTTALSDYPSASSRIVDATTSIDRKKGSIKKEEQDGRSKKTPANLFDTIWLFFVNSYATLLVFAFHLISIESLVSIGLSVGFTIFTYYQTDNQGGFDGGIMDWILLSFAIVTPMTSSIGFAFTRREDALKYIFKIRSLFFGIYHAHACWDWDGKDPSGRETSKVDWLVHSDAILEEIFQISDELCLYLTLPSTGRARHKMTKSGQQHANDIVDVMDRLIGSIYMRMNRLSLHTEVLKAEGMPGNESSRIRQWELFILDEIEKLQVIKQYRTPQALRSLCRIFSVLLPPLYSPYYAQMARDLGSLGTAVTFSVLTSLILTALFESLSQMEDPFVAHITLDGIDVPRELRDRLKSRLLSQRNNVFYSGANVEFKGMMNEPLISDSESKMSPRLFTAD